METTSLHFFPFNTVTENPIEGFNNVQGLYVESYPEFLAGLFSAIPNVTVYTCFNNISRDAETGEKGFSNWTLDGLQYLVKTRNHPMTGYGVAGGLIFDDRRGGSFRIEIVDVSRKVVLKPSRQVRFKLEKIFDVVVHSAIAFIIKNCQLDESVREKIVIPESILRNPRAFLVFLQINMLRRRTFLPEVFSTGRILDAFFDCFREQPDFLVLHYLFLEFIDTLTAPEIGPFKDKIQAIDRLIESKQEAAAGYLRQGVRYDDKGEHDAAVSLYSKAIELHPGYSDAFWKRGRLRLYALPIPVDSCAAVPLRCACTTGLVSRGTVANIL